MALDVDSICTDLDLQKELGGVSKLQRAGVDLTGRDAIRREALADFLDVLAQRTPPIFEHNIAKQEELKKGVLYRSLERIFRQARAVNGDTFDATVADYRREREREFGRTITVDGGLRGPSGGTFSLERR